MFTRLDSESEFLGYMQARDRVEGHVLKWTTDRDVQDQDRESSVLGQSHEPG